jgi:hypothetical protein
VKVVRVIAALFLFAYIGTVVAFAQRTPPTKILTQLPRPPRSRVESPPVVVVAQPVDAAPARKPRRKASIVRPPHTARPQTPPAVPPVTANAPTPTPPPAQPPAPAAPSPPPVAEPAPPVTTVPVATPPAPPPPATPAAGPAAAPSTPSTPPPVPPAPPTATAPADDSQGTRPGNGWGDANHDHTGPPGHTKP